MQEELLQKMTNNLRGYLTTQNHGLRDYQQEILNKSADFLGLPIEAQIFTDDPDSIKQGQFFEVVSATGTGKTRIFGALAKGMGVNTLILTPRNIINKQTVSEMSAELGVNPKEVAIYDSTQTNAEKKRALDPKNPPKYLVMSYQSLLSMPKRELHFADENSPYYKPLIICDEIHKGKGMKTRALLQSFFNKSLVAAFTATDAGVSETLFMGQPPIYEQPITKAVEHGRLCDGIRTAVIDVKIDEDWIKNFKNTSQNSDFSEELIEQFCRHPAVIQAETTFHLKRKDPILGDLHRLPTLFFVEGVKSAREGALRYNEMAKELGIKSYADYVSGTMSPDERDEKLKALKSGKIQSLWNDEVLEMGYNDRDVTVVYGKPTMVPHIAEQELGRTTRKSNGNYKERFGADKVALAVSVRAAGTNPVLFGEILNGKPFVYKIPYDGIKQGVGGGPPGPKVEKPDVPDNIEFHTEYNDLVDVLVKSAAEREKKAVKPDGWSSAIDASIMIFGTPNNPRVHSIFNDIKEQLQEKKSDQTYIDVGGKNIPLKDASSFYTLRGNSHVCVKNKHLEIIKDIAVGDCPSRTEEYLTAEEMAKLTGNDIARVKNKYDAFAKIKDEWLHSGGKYGELVHVYSDKIPAKAMDYMKTADGVRFVINCKYASIFETQKKTPEMLNYGEMGSLTGWPRKVQMVYEWLEGSYPSRQEGQKYIEYGPFRVEVDKAGYRERGWKYFCLSRDYIPLFQKEFKIHPKTEEWLDKKDLSRIFGYRENSVNNAVHDLMDDLVSRRLHRKPDEDNLVVEYPHRKDKRKITIHFDETRLIKGNGSQQAQLAVHVSTLPKIEAYLGKKASMIDIPASNENKASDDSVFGIKKHDITPSSEHIQKRTGRVRAAG